MSLLVLLKIKRVGGVDCKHTDGLASVAADLLEVLGGGVLGVAAVLGEVAGDLVGLLGADGLDVGRVRAFAAQLLVHSRAWKMRRIVLDGGKEACRGSCDNDARSDGEDGEDSGSLCEHGVKLVLFWGLEVVDIKGFGVKKDGKNGYAPQKSGR